VAARRTTVTIEPWGRVSRPARESHRGGDRVAATADPRADPCALDHLTRGSGLRAGIEAMLSHYLTLSGLPGGDE
jgi:hypothetical protein